MSHKIGKGNVKLQTETLQYIKGTKRPHTKKEVRSFLGVAGYYSDFILNYEENTDNLTELANIRSANTVVREAKHQKRFGEIKMHLS